MTDKAAKVGAMITRKLTATIHHHLSDPDFDLDDGEIQLIDHDHESLYFGLFETDEDTGLLKEEPSIIWTIEVFADLNAGQ